jgi:gliding motility-associated-like protein
MKRIVYILGLLLTLATAESRAQISLSYTTDCSHDTLFASLTGMVPISSGISADDNYTSSIIPIGFTFNFYGTPYTQLLIGSNGNLCFDVSLVGAYDPWPISAALLGNSSVYNCVCGPWCDIYQVVPPSTGSIMYATVGVAPNRKFECTWCGCSMFSCTTQWITTQIILYEGTNNIEVHIQHKDICSWNGGYAIVGVQNATGTAATAAPGRDYPSVWSIMSSPYEAWRFTPVGTTSYSCSSIPYAAIPYAASAVYWYDSTTGAYISSGPSIVVTPTVTTTYRACAVGCHDTISSYITMNPVGSGGSGGGGAPHISGITYTNPTACGMCNGTFTLHGVKPHQIDTVFYSLAGVTHTLVDSAALDSTITITGLCGGAYTGIYVKVGNCPSNIVSVTLVTPVLAISNETFTNATVCGVCNGSITLYGLTPLQPVSVAYNFNGTPAAPVTGFVNGDSTFVLTGLCAGNYTSIVATIGLCSAPGINEIITQPILSISNETITNPTVCGKCDGSIKLYGLTPLSPVTVNYNVFEYGGSLAGTYSTIVASDSTVLVPNLCGGTYTGIKATIGACFANTHDTVLVDPAVGAWVDTVAIRLGCVGDTILLTDSLSFPSGYQYYVDFGDLTGWDSTHLSHVYHDYPQLAGNYTVILKHSTYYNAYCTAYDTLPVIINHAIKAGFTSDRDTQCVALPIYFTDTSNPTGAWGIASVNWDFGDNQTGVGHNPIHAYAQGGLYTVRQVVTDYLGCRDSAKYAYYDIPSIQVKLNHHDTLVCLGQDSMLLAGTLYDTIGYIRGFSYAWTPQAQLGSPFTDSTNFLGVGNYVYTLTVTTIPSGSQPCNVTDTVNIVSFPPLVLTNVTPNQTVPYGSTVQLNADNADYYWWTPANGTISNPNINNPTVTPLDSTTTYTVYGMTTYGCVDSQTVTIFLDNAMEAYVPTAFSPNNDGLNDYFHVVNLRYQKLVELRVFNRWGQQVYATSDASSKGWDGTFNGIPQDIGVYTYELILAKVDGTQKTYTGMVTLIR